jgi:endonuclease/exonuclease/phosphatase family metal-dependent hydrolase
VKSNTNTYNAWNQPARRGREPIDFIFFTKGDFEVESYEVLNEDLGEKDNYADKVYASDHFAIVSEIEL